MALVVDASVWVSAADASDAFSETSRHFLLTALRRRTAILLPAITRLEVACALARRLRDAGQGRELAEELLRSPLVNEAALDAPLLTAALARGTAAFLRAADALYVAAAQSTDAELVAWDRELICRAGALSPETWLTRHART
jgi:predicted nucleic acid-binding protein